MGSGIAQVSGASSAGAWQPASVQSDVNSDKVVVCYTSSVTNARRRSSQTRFATKQPDTINGVCRC